MTAADQTRQGCGCCGSGPSAHARSLGHGAWPRHCGGCCGGRADASATAATRTRRRHRHGRHRCSLHDADRRHRCNGLVTLQQPQAEPRGRVNGGDEHTGHGRANADRGRAANTGTTAQAGAAGGSVRAVKVNKRKLCFCVTYLKMHANRRRVVVGCRLSLAPALPELASTQGKQKARSARTRKCTGPHLLCTAIRGAAPDAGQASAAQQARCRRSCSAIAV